MIEIDGSYGEGGGQLVRTAVALSAVTGKAIHIVHARAKRGNPGLAPQHLAAVRAVAEICAADTEGLELRALSFTFSPRKLRGGNYRFDIGTANVEFRWEVFNLFNTDNFSNPVATLPSSLGTGTNQIQPEQPFTPAAAGTFGSLTSTVGRTVGLGTNRQMQFALRLNF